MSGLILDLRAGWRTLTRAPGYTAVAVLMLALGIGANTAIFGIVRNVLLRPLPFDSPEQLLHVCEDNPQVGYCVTSPPNAYDWAARSVTLDGVGLVRGWHYSMKRGEQAQGVDVAIVTPELLQVLRLRPQLGRLLQPADQQGVGARVLVLLDETWRSQFGADPRVVGSTVQLDGEPYEIVGVAPPGLKLPNVRAPAAIKPLHIDPRSEEHRDWRGFMAIARMKPGVTVEAARADLARVAAALSQERPDANAGWSVQVETLHESVVGRVRPMLLVFTAAVALVLLIVCANTANLMLARAARRQHELAVRVATGASRGRLVRQLLVEAAMIAAAAAAAGYLLAIWGTGALLALAPRQLPRIAEIRMGADGFAFAAGLAVLVALTVGLAPALWASRAGVQQVLRNTDGRSARGFGRGRAALVVAEVALSVMLLAAAGVLVRSLVHQLQWSPGFDRDGIIVTQVFPPADRYPESSDLTAFYDRAKQELRALPGVARVGSASAGPMFGGLDAFSFRVDGRGGDAAGNVRAFDVDESYFGTLGLRIVRGRGIARTDDENTPPVIVVNESFARQNWGDADPVGRTVQLIEAEWDLQVVGVVQDVTPFPGDEEMNGPAVYTAQRQEPRGGSFLVVRTAGDPVPLVSTVQAKLLALEPDLSISVTGTMADRMREYTAQPRFNLLILGLFAASALLLAIAGLYSVIAYTAAQRLREFGIRLALGARPRDVVAMVLRQAGALVLAGVLTGGVGAALSARLLDAVVVGVKLRDPLLFAAVAALIAAAALIATLGPALRAARQDPAGALREV